LNKLTIYANVTENAT